MRKLLVVSIALFLSCPAQAQESPATLPRPPLTVATAEAGHGRVTPWLFAEGVAQAARKEFLQFRQAGRVIEIPQDGDGRGLRAGSRVTAGTVLGRLDPVDMQTALTRAEAEAQASAERLRAATATRDQALSDLERQRRLTERGVGARAQLDTSEGTYRTAEAGLLEAQANMVGAEAEVAAARLAVERTELVAPFDGTIALMNIRVGEDVTGGAGETDRAAQERAAAVVLIDDGQFDITLHLPPADAEGLTEGQLALAATNGTTLARHVRAQAQTGVVIEGQVWSVSPSITLQRRAVTVVVRFEAGADLLRDGALATVWIERGNAADVLRIPYDAVIQRGEGYYTYAVVGDHAERRPLGLGLQGLDHVQVLEGLEAGDQVVIRGQHRLSDGAPVRVVETAE